jgi:chromate transporter
MDKCPTITNLFFSFLRLGATAFGGPAMVAYIKEMAVGEKKWLDEETFRDGVALAQTIPGATSMQTAAYVGLRTRGIPGAAASFVGFGLPAFIFLMVLSAIYVRASHVPVVVSLFNGLQAMVIAVVANATVSFGLSYLKGWRESLIAGGAAVMFGFRINPVYVIVLAAVWGMPLFRNTHLPGRQIISRKARHRIPYIALLFAIAAVWFALLFTFSRPLFSLSALMSKIDLFAFGGGYASVPLMFHEVVEARSWMDARTFLNGIALGQVTPGPIVLTATFVGYLLHGPLGGVVASVGIFLPSFIIIVGVVPYFDRLKGSSLMTGAFGGVLCSFVGLLFSVTLRFASDIPWDLARALLAGAAFAALRAGIRLPWVVLAGAAVSFFMM